MTSLVVTIGNITIDQNHNAKEIPFDDTQKHGKIFFNRNSGDKYTIAMVDPDAGKKIKGKYWLHMLVINNDKVVVKYQPPAPPSGSGDHHYIFYLLKQNRKLSIDSIERKDFDLEEFMKKNNLVDVTNVFFVTKR